MRLANASLNFLNLLAEGLWRLRDFKSLAHERIANFHDSLSDLGSILEYNDVDSFVGEFAELLDSIGIWIVRIINDILEEGQRLATSSSEEKSLEPLLLLNLNGPCYIGDAHISILQERGVVVLNTLNTASQSKYYKWLRNG